MYTEHNFRTKKELRAAVELNNVPVQRHTNGGPFPESAGPKKSIEGPHYPEAHKWYAECPVIERDGELFIPAGAKVL